MRTRLAVALVASVCIAACSVNGSYSVSIAAGLHPNRNAEAVVSATRAYLDAQTPSLAAPELHTPPQVTAVWAVRASDAPAIDGCIPPGEGDRIVWITKGRGDYLLDMRAQVWHAPRNQSLCEGGGTEGTMVIDDATGQILGVYPESPGLPHPSP